MKRAGCNFKCTEENGPHKSVSDVNFHFRTHQKFNCVKEFLLKMKQIWILSILVTLWSHQVTTKEVKERMKRFSIFSLVQFPNTQCVLAMSTPTNVMMGTCFTESECAANGGRASGNCASGFGVCCMYSVQTCGSIVSRNCTYIQNPGYPSSFTTAMSCSYSFQTTTDICQIRLDLDDVVFTQPPDAGGSCTLVDMFKVTSASSSGAAFTPNPPVLCGTLSGSHMYFETGRQVNGGSISITTVNPLATAPTRSWKIKATFIECGNPRMAPNDCLQYFTALSGTFESFNYKNSLGTLIEKQNYNVCFRQADGFCELSLRQDTSNAKSFVLKNAANEVTSKRAACAEAALLIPTSSGTIAADKTETYCGTYLSSLEGETLAGEIIANVNPWYVGVFSKTGLTAAIMNTGFKVGFQQQPCA